MPNRSPVGASLVTNPQPLYVAPKRSEQERRQVPVRTRGYLLFGFACVAIAIGGFGGWAATAPIASAVITRGSITVDSKRKAVQHLEGGIVKEILVRDGQRVGAGQVLLRLDETRARASLAILSGAYNAERAREARLFAERDERNHIEFPKELVDRRHIAAVRAVLEGQRRLFRARQRAMAGEIEILEQRSAQYQQQIAGLHAQQRAKERQIALISAELKDLMALYRRGHTTRRRILALQREAAKLEGERGEHIADVAKAKTAVGETKLRMLQIRKKVREEVVAQLREVQSRAQGLVERITAATHVLNHIEIRAPVGGTVVGMNISTVGGVIRAGETILEIVPGQDRLIVEARVRPEDVDNVAIGMPADINLTGLKRRTSRAIPGRVTYISADSLSDRRSGLSYYLVRVEITGSLFRTIGDKPLQPGMPAEVILKSGNRTAMQYLVQPILDSMNRAWREE